MKNETALRNLVAETLIPHTAFETASKRIFQCCEFGIRASDPVCLAIVGESRTGKSRLLEECSAAFPTRRTNDGIIKPVLSVVTPSKPTVKGLAAEMLKAIGDPRHAEGTEIAKTARLYRQMEEVEVRMLHIDEFQHFFDKATNQVMHHVADWLKSLVDQTKVVLIVSGLPSCRRVIDQNEQLAGRFLAPMIMPRFNWADDNLREEFLAILAAFHESMSEHFSMPELGSEEMGLRIYCATGGLMGYVARLLRQIVWNALSENNRQIGLANFAKANDDCYWGHEDAPPLESFSDQFNSTPTPKLLANAAKLGIRKDDYRPGSRSSLSMKPKASLVLSAR